MILKGGNNIQLLAGKNSTCRIAMTMDSLLVLGHWIKNCGWSVHSSQVVWSACLLAFFSSCRLGEILAPCENRFDPATTLLWKHVNFSSANNISVFLPFTKTRGLHDELVELFAFEPFSCCPIAAIKNLKKLAIESRQFNTDFPVFAFKSGKFLTTTKLNTILERFSIDSLTCHAKFSCHSFRAAIPTLISSHPNRSHVSDILEWGRWSSDSYKVYLKMDKMKKFMLFRKIASLLIDSVKK